MKLLHQSLELVGLPHLAYEAWWHFRCPFELKTQWNERNRAFFIHIPKTAGTSVYDSLAMDKLPYTHAPARILRNFYPAEYAEYFTFAFVRNPWDRFVSTFEFLRSETVWEEQKFWARSHIGDQQFSEFVLRLKREPRFRAAILAYNFFYTQKYFVSDWRRRIIVKNIYRFEDVQSAFGELANRFGVAQPLSHSRKTKGRAAYQSYYNAETWDVVGNLYAEDVLAFGYNDEIASDSAQSLQADMMA